MTAPAYDRWVFDLDGTLVDVEEGYVYDVIGRVDDRLGYEFSERQAEIIWYGLGGERSEWLDSWGIDPDQFWSVFHDEEDAEARADATFLYDDAAFVAEIDAPTALVTHCQEYLTEPVLRTLDIADWFDSIVCCTADTGWKPDPKPVRTALSTAGAKTGTGDSTSGDNPHDIGAA